ncbi:hypothetical protein SNEBB_001054 [Seison nebaliae]|nr:hypothetical protein SNEBB_001054 [Seison nebaliae]
MAIKLNLFKILLSIFNVVILILGLVLLTLGIYSKLNFNTFFQVADHVSNKVSYSLIGCGAFIILCGCLFYCCIKKNRANLLNIYAVILFILFGMIIGLGATGFLSKGQLKESFRNGLNESMIAYNTSSADPRKMKAVDNVQSVVKCCGVDSFQDWFSTDFARVIKQVPKSCCNVPDDECTHQGTVTKYYTVYNEGCYSKIVSKVDSSMAIIGGVIFGFAVLLLLGMILTCYYIRTAKNYQEMD